MTDLRKAAEMALEALEIHVPQVYKDRGYEPIQALRQALTQPEQEPVACIGTTGELMWLNKPKVIYNKPQPLYTAPSKREWVGLTQDDKNELFNNWWNKNQSFNKLIEDTEEKLMEKNNG